MNTLFFKSLNNFRKHCKQKDDPCHYSDALDQLEVLSNYDSIVEFYEKMKEYNPDCLIDHLEDRSYKNVDVLKMDLLSHMMSHFMERV